MSPPPRVPSPPLVGSLPTLLVRQLRFLEAARRKHGPIFTLDLGIGNAVVLAHPRHVQHVFVDQARTYTKAGAVWDSFRATFGNGLTVSEGDFWRRQRRLLQPAFHSQRIAALGENMVTAIDRSLDSWEPAANGGKRFDVADAFTDLTMQVAVRSMFGTAVAAQEVERITTSFGYVIDHMLHHAMTAGLPAWLPVPWRRRYGSAIRTTDEIVVEMIRRGRAARDGAGTVLQLLLDAVDDESATGMNDAQVRDEVMSLFFAGYETTAASLAWALYELTQAPQLFERLEAEVDQVLGGRRPAAVDLPALVFTKNAMLEALRLYPPAYFVTRVAGSDDTIDGHDVAAGQTVAVVIYLIHRDPELWDDPSRFDPDRHDAARAGARPKHAFMPFGAGQHLCIGRDVAMMEGALALARMAQRFRVRARPGRVGVRPRSVLRPSGGVWVTLEQRLDKPRPS
jgi:cytochrome P450